MLITIFQRRKQLLISVIFCFGFSSFLAAADSYRLEKMAGGLDEPLFLVSAHDGTGRLFIVEQAGKIKTMKNRQIDQKLFLNIRDRVKSGGELGLLGLAFHPQFKTNRKFYLNYTTKTRGLKTRISEFRVPNNKTDKTEKTERIFLEFDQPYSNHNGGHLEFGPDGYLYIGVGDGGSAGDPHRHGQNLSTLLGSILRIDVNHPRTYRIPKDNPFVKTNEARGEIWAYGLRNPWRFSFDPLTKKLYAADVGQDAWEEINIIQKGKNYGWNVMEGNHCFLHRGCNVRNLDFPIFEYGHQEGISITGGYVYRGKKHKKLVGHYIYGDYGSGKIWAFKYEKGRVKNHRLLIDSDLAISSFGIDDDNKLYVIDHQPSERGTIYIITSRK